MRESERQKRRVFTVEKMRIKIAPSNVVIVCALVWQVVNKKNVGSIEKLNIYRVVSSR